MIGAKRGSKALQTVKGITKSAAPLSWRRQALAAKAFAQALFGTFVEGVPKKVMRSLAGRSRSLHWNTSFGYRCPEIAFTLLRDGWKCDAEQVEQYEVLTTAKRILDWKPSFTDSAQQLFDLCEAPTYRPQCVNGPLHRLREVLHQLGATLDRQFPPTCTEIQPSLSRESLRSASSPRDDCIRPMETALHPMCTLGRCEDCSTGHERHPPTSRDHHVAVATSRHQA